MAGKKKVVSDVMLMAKPDRRLLAHVPDPERIRSNQDRRKDTHTSAKKPQYATFAGQRYLAEFPVTVSYKGRHSVQGQCEDISQTGMLLRFPPEADIDRRYLGKACKLKFNLLPGVLHEGTEKRFRVEAAMVRDNGDGRYGFRLREPLYQYLRRTKNSFTLSIASFFMFLVVLGIVALRVESVIYFESNKVLFIYSLITAGFLLTRYLFGAMYKPIPIDPEYTPAVTIIIPCFNEEEWISRTILSCVDQDYPVDKLKLIIVDDGSSDGSVQAIQRTVQRLWEEDARFHTRERIRVFFQRSNFGKREAMALGIRNTDTELIAFVDSDSFLEPDAIRHLVQPLYDPKTAGVTGRTDVVNAYTNNLTKMQAVRYYISFRFLKAAEAYFDSVMCLSGPLSCYRTSAVLEVLEPWINQTFLGQKATFGDDRSLTNYIVHHHRTYYQDTAICSTLVPNKHKQFLKQQMRWKRSWMRESLKAGKFMWRKEPLMAFSFYVGLLIPLIAPIIVLYNLVYVPIFQHAFPGTFLIGLALMALLMSCAQLLMKKSSLWIYGVVFCLYYEAVLLWQMPWAWVTFWVSNWGTRQTSSSQKKQKKQKEQKKRKKDASSAEAPPGSIDPGAAKDPLRQSF